MQEQKKHGRNRLDMAEACRQGRNRRNMMEQAGTGGICRIRTDRQDHAGTDMNMLEQPGKLRNRHRVSPDRQEHGEHAILGRTGSSRQERHEHLGTGTNKRNTPDR
jgi:hypothetical protein